MARPCDSAVDAKARLDVESGTEVVETVEQGAVIDRRPGGGDVVNCGVDLWEILGESWITMPDVPGPRLTRNVLEVSHHAITQRFLCVVPAYRCMRSGTDVRDRDGSCIPPAGDFIHSEGVEPWAGQDVALLRVARAVPLGPTATTCGEDRRPEQALPLSGRLVAASIPLGAIG